MEGKVDEIKSVESMLKIPVGSGEKSMLRFGPNCAIVTFLNATNPGAVRKYLPLLQNGCVLSSKCQTKISFLVSFFNVRL